MTSPSFPNIRSALDDDFSILQKIIDEKVNRIDKLEAIKREKQAELTALSSGNSGSGEVITEQHAEEGVSSVEYDTQPEIFDATIKE